MSTVLEIIRHRLSRLGQIPSLMRLRHQHSHPHWSMRSGQIRVYHPSPEEARIQGLRSTCDLLADGFEDLEQLLAAYVQEVQPTSTTTNEEDVEGFLQWLARKEAVSEEQRDFITCQRARLSVEYIALGRRLAHARFQALLQSRAGRQDWQDWLEQQRHRLIHLNPVRVLATLDTHVLIEDCAALPATVLFYPVAGEVCSVIVNEQMSQVLQILGHGALPLRRLAQLVDLSWDELLNMLEELARIGVVAY